MSEMVTQLGTGKTVLSSGVSGSSVNPWAAPGSPDALDPWILTRRISPRADVRVMQREADGGLHENSYPRYHRVGPASPTTPWAMYLADDDGLFRLLCFDFDGKAKDGDDAVERAVDDCDALSTLLDDLAIAHVVCRSSSSGGRHIWVPVAGAPAEVVGRVARAARALYRSLDHGMLLNPRQGAARPPLSPHRDGSSSVILRGDPIDLISTSTRTTELLRVAEVLDARVPAIRSDRSMPSGPVDSSHSSHKPLSPWGEGHMATVGGGSNPSWTAFMCLLAAASAGWSYADVQRAVRSAPGMEHYRTKNAGRGERKARDPHEAAERLERQWEKAQQYSALHARLPKDTTESDEPRDLENLETLVSTAADLLNRFAVSPGRWGRTERAVSERTTLTALAYLTLQTGKQVVAASIRDLALISGLGRTTSAEALQGLRAAGFVELVVGADAGNAAEWRLVPDFSTGTGPVRSQPLNNPRPPAAADLFNRRSDVVSTIEEQLTDGRHDLFTRGGLGHLAGKVYAMLRDRAEVSVEQAARWMGVSVRHTVTIFSRLSRHKLIVRDGDGWRRSRRDLRKSAAKDLGVDGMLKVRAARYAAERDVWAWWQAEEMTMNTPPQRRPRRPHVSSRTLFAETTTPGERVWPRYPRGSDGRGDHREARYWADNGMLEPGSLWMSSSAA